MSTATKANNLETYAKTKKYVYITETYYQNGGFEKYAHPTILFYELYHYEGQYSRGFVKFKIEYQTHQKDGTWIPAYAGSIEGANLENIDDIQKILHAANKKQQELNIYCGDKYRNMITALRAAGYKEGHGDEHYITWID